MGVDISGIWSELAHEVESIGVPTSRVYRALGGTAIGVRASFVPLEGTLELLVEVPFDWAAASSLPEWRGMRFDVIDLALPPRPEAHHVRLYLEDREHEAVFLTFCQDVVDALEGLPDPDARTRELEECIARWSRFFQKCGPDGLPPGAQRGLFGELHWMGNILDAGVSPTVAVVSWKGCERGYHDFDIAGEVVEAKSTMTKEPRSVRISNERQLDDRGLRSLHLFVASLHSAEGGGVTLPEQVDAVRDALAASAGALSRFERCLVSAGYLDQHAPQYAKHYTIKEEALFRVADGFPRIIDVPHGVGRLRYAVALSACQPYEVDLPSHLQGLGEREDG